MLNVQPTFRILIPVFLTCLLFTTAAVAAGEFLTLVSSSVENDAEDISCQPVIEFTFSNNVVNMKVSEQNMTCFTLLDAENNKVEIDVIMADDQIEPEKKRIISVTPVSALKPQTSYSLLIAETLAAKNGNTLEKGIGITFTTGNGDDAKTE